ncbi:uncharacterized protein LOC124137757 isoform X1 [Haliotis rufescens]|uniref:uncharacterized protein LOC124137757 isoform X1 n=1 Tax=Haliotis rufescens TaxID=6454 RepID=UPI00201EF82A|nr:uncharacterized protein LOC124137757 isoform X1 [Haliotis rufescens]
MHAGVTSERHIFNELRHSRNMACIPVVLFIFSVVVTLESSFAETTCQSLGGTCKGPLWSNVQCEGQSRFPMAGCGGTNVCCLPKQTVPQAPVQSTCQDKGGTCKGPIWSGVQCDGPLEYGIPGCTTNEWCCEPGPKPTTPEPNTTITKEKTCASVCGSCQSIQMGCQGYGVPDTADCNLPSQRCCVRAWIGPCPGK